MFPQQHWAAMFFFLGDGQNFLDDTYVCTYKEC